MRILITGGLGFVGGRLGQYLQGMGHHITLGSRKKSSPPNWLQDAKITKTDWRHARALEESCIEIDVVIHAAGMNAQDAAADPIGALESNGLATARLVAAANRTGVKRFIYLSTAHVYASPLSGRITEALCPRNLHPYATSHLSGEHAVLNSQQRGAVEGLVLRLSNVFGAPAHNDVNCWMLLVNDLCRQAVETRKLVLNSSGLQQRDFIPMSQVCRLIGLIISSNFTAGSNAILNVGSGVSKTVLEMTELISGRCAITLGYTPDLHRIAEGDGRQVEDLEYRVDGLRGIGLSPENSDIEEIDKLLNFCQILHNSVGTVLLEKR